MTAKRTFILTGLAVIAAVAGCPLTEEMVDASTNGSAGSSDNGSDSSVNDTISTLQAQLAALEAAVTSQVYGDGSAGSRTVGSEGTLLDSNLQFENFTVPEGVTVIIQSGAKIRCTGTFINNGTILVRAGADGGDRQEANSSALAISTREPVGGISTLGAGSGEVGGASAARVGGSGGEGLSEFESGQVLNLGVAAGGGGGAALSSGGDGGGSLVVIAQDAIVNHGEIHADGVAGSSGAGGGAGGVIVLASKSSVTNAASGIITAAGGDGGDSGDAEGPGGGGGGGIVHLLAPSITNDGDTSVSGGSAGATGAAGSITAESRSGGGGGGGAGGAGGAGGSISEGDSADPQAAEAGSAGFFLMNEVDPTALF